MCAAGEEHASCFSCFSFFIFSSSSSSKMEKKLILLLVIYTAFVCVFYSKYRRYLVPYLVLPVPGYLENDDGKKMGK